MRTLHVYSHWQTGNSIIQLAVASICAEEFGFEQVTRYDSNKVAEPIPLIKDHMWEIIYDYLGQGRDPRMSVFYENDTLLQGYYQDSVPLVQLRERIMTAFKNDTRLHFPITCSGATITDLLSAVSPVELRPTDVVVHVRLGDFHKANLVIDPAPQLAILREIRRSEPETRVILVCQAPKTEAEQNYLRFFEEFRPIIQSGTEVEDFAVLRSANRILVTNSTFSWAAAWLGTASERWIPEPTYNALGQISESDILYTATNGYDLSGLVIPSELLPVTGEFLQGLCDFTVLDKKKHDEFHVWIDAVVPKERQLFIESEWGALQPKSVFVYPEAGLLEAVEGKWPDLRLVVVHNGDNQVNYEVLLRMLDANPKLYAWIQNNTVSHPRIRSLPIAEQNRIWRGGRVDWEPTVSISRNPNRECDFLYPYCKDTHAIRSIWSKEAMALRTKMLNLELYTGAIPIEDYIETFISAKAIVCPRGNGVDTHRTWEALYKGAWAILENNPHTQVLLNQYPSLPFITISSPSELPNVKIPIEIPSPFHPMLLRVFWKKLFDSYTI
jgi:hypothetical protein